MNDLAWSAWIESLRREHPGPFTDYILRAWETGDTTFPNLKMYPDWLKDGDVIDTTGYVVDRKALPEGEHDGN